MDRFGLFPGAYESVVTESLARLLESMEPDAVESDEVAAAEIPDRLGLIAADLTERALRSLSDEERASVGPTLVRALAEQLAAHSAAVDEGDRVVAPARVLRSLSIPLPGGGWRRPPRPMIPLLDTTVLTGARGEPTLMAQLASEIPSADSIDVIVAFIRQTGLRPLLAALRDHVADGRLLRVLTTTYTGSTEQRALDLLSELGAQIRVSYDETGTRLHAKSWLFQRVSGTSTAYVGSSNLTHQAQVSGLEWNVRLSGRRNAAAVEKLAAVFSSYWDSGDFLPYDPVAFATHMQSRQRAPSVQVTPFEVAPYPFQRRMLEQLELARRDGQHRNLVAAATGTGKTVLAAFDYKRLRRELSSNRLLFVAHRQEILEQSLRVFRDVLRDPGFGELWAGGLRPSHGSHVFASVQSLTAAGIESIEPEHFDVVIVDEFHHAAAETYDRLLRHVEPQELLGLTATPERADGRSILHWFNERITVELRLWDAIDQQRLAPFLYFGVDDGSDLRHVPRRGREYDVDALSSLYTADTLWVTRVLREIARLVPDPSRMTALGFCASVSHAEFTAAAFTREGIRSAAVSGRTPDQERRRILDDLRTGHLRCIFSVDVLSEGVDVPEVDTLLLMRPTESATVFLQQLGRGLRKAEGKATCHVLDFIGLQATGFRFDLRYRALLGGSRSELQRAVESDFPYLPAGCQLVLEPVAAARVLDSLKHAIPSTWNQQLRELMLLSADRDPSLDEYLSATGLELEDVYRGDRSWMQLRAEAGLATPTEGTHNLTFRRALARLLHVDDDLRLSTYRGWLEESAPPQPTDEAGRRLLRMLVTTLIRSLPDGRQLALDQATALVWGDARLRGDLLALLGSLASVAETRGYPVVPWREQPPLPLRIHARYTRDEILAATGSRPGSVRPPAWQTGVWYEPSLPADLLAFTLDKTARSFSPTTRYRDYAISESLIHWESQGVTRAASETGRRYVEHEKLASAILLFARPTTDDRAFWFLGPATYVSHEGERPMAITWRLHVPLPETLYNAMVVAAA